MRRKGRCAGNLFRQKADPDACVRDTRSRIDRGRVILIGKPANRAAVGHLVDLHLPDLKAAVQAPGANEALYLLWPESLLRLFDSGRAHRRPHQEVLSAAFR